MTNLQIVYSTKVFLSGKWDSSVIWPDLTFSPLIVYNTLSLILVVQVPLYFGVLYSKNFKQYVGYQKAQKRNALPCQHDIDYKHDLEVCETIFQRQKFLLELCGFSLIRRERLFYVSSHVSALKNGNIICKSYYFQTNEDCGLPKGAEWFYMTLKFGWMKNWILFMHDIFHIYYIILYIFMNVERS